MSAIEKWTRCGQVIPFWVDIGWVRWAGHSEREKMFNIVYRRCENAPESPVKKDGFIFHLCSEHRK